MPRQTPSYCALPRLLTLPLPSTWREPPFPTSTLQVCIAVLNKVAEKSKGVKDLVAIEEKLGSYCEKPANEKEGKLVGQRGNR